MDVLGSNRNCCCSTNLMFGRARDSSSVFTGKRYVRTNVAGNHGGTRAIVATLAGEVNQAREIHSETTAFLLDRVTSTRRAAG
jgi:hypothetical protein